MLIRLSLIAASLAFVGSSGDPIPHVSAARTAIYAKACNHYVNRARFKNRRGDAEFVTVLADSCLQARASLVIGSYAERWAAQAYLSRLLDLRDTVIEMNMTRLFGADRTPYSRLKHKVGSRIEPVPKVSKSGEYLIAYRIGLVHAYRVWRDTHPEVEVAVTGGH